MQSGEKNQFSELKITEGLLLKKKELAVLLPTGLECIFLFIAHAHVLL